MTLTPCAPCDCVPGNISNDKFKQDVEVILCQILTALGGAGESVVLSQQTFTGVGNGVAAGPFSGLSKISLQAYATGGQPDDWSIELYGSFDGITYGRILTHALGENNDGGYVLADVVGVLYIKPVVKVLSLGGATNVKVNVFGNSFI